MEITDDEIPDIIEKVIRAGECTHLDLCTNKITSEGVKDIIIELRTSGVRGRWLDLSENPIGDEGVKLCAELLKENRTVRLILNNTKMTDQGVRYLCDALKTKSSSVVLLEIGDNKSITDASIASLSTMINLYPMLIFLNLSGCGFSKIGKQQLEEAAKKIDGFGLIV